MGLRDAFRIPPDPWSGGAGLLLKKKSWFAIFIVDAINIGHRKLFMFLTNILDCRENIYGLLKKKRVGLVANIYY
jgi:hypothetical protein